MSRTRKGSKPVGYDFSSRYSCDRNYSGSTGKVPKDLADSERRNSNKKLIEVEIDEMLDNMESYIWED